MTPVGILLLFLGAAGLSLALVATGVSLTLWIQHVTRTGAPPVRLPKLFTRKPDTNGETEPAPQPPQRIARIGP